MNTRSLRFRITAWYAGLLAGALLVFGVSVYLGLERYLYWDLQSTLDSSCRTIATQLLSQHPFKRADWLETEINEAYAPEVNGHFIRVIQEGELRRIGENVTRFLDATSRVEPDAGELSPGLLRNALDALRRNFDPTHGGFGDAPKFPHALELKLLLRARRSLLRGGGTRSVAPVKIGRHARNLGRHPFDELRMNSGRPSNCR